MASSEAAPMGKTKLNGVFAQILNGWDSGNGEGGVVLVEGDRCRYLFPSDIPNPTISQGIARAIEQDTEKRLFFVIVRESEKSAQADVVAYERGHVFASARESLIEPPRDPLVT